MENKQVKLSLVVITCALAAALTGCDKGQSYRIPYNTLCEVRTMDVAEVSKSCKQGERLLFTPASWGSEQLPVMFAALHCNPEYAIAMTKGSVSCVYQGVDFEHFLKRSVTEEKPKADK